MFYRNIIRNASDWQFYITHPSFLNPSGWYNSFEELYGFLSFKYLNLPFISLCFVAHKSISSSTLPFLFYLLQLFVIKNTTG